MSNPVTRPIVWVPPNVHTEYLHRVLRGIARYRNENRDWVLTYPPARYPATPSEQVVGALLWGEETSDVLDMAHHLPCVQLSNSAPHRSIPAVTADDRMAGALAAGHFLERGFRVFAFVGSEKSGFSRERREGFRDHLRRHAPDAEFLAFLHPTHHALRASGGVERLLRDLRRHPPPWALFCCDDWWARFLLEESRSFSIALPGELSVLGVNNESHVCEISDTPLSSVDLPAEEIGYEGARLLDRLIHGGRPDRAHTRIPVARVVTRASTDIAAVSDPVVSKALSLMQAGLAEEVAIPDIARKCGVSRRVLERRFRETLNTSPHQRLIRFRVDRAKSLLRATHWPLRRVALESGFVEQKYLSVRFKQLEGLSPLQWRKRHTGG